MDNHELLLKPTGTIQIVNKFSLVERKLLNGIIWHAQNRGKLSQEEHSLPLAQVFDMIGLPDSRNYELIKDALTALASTIIRWNGLAVDRQNEWGVCTFLASGKIRGGKVHYRLNPELVEKINNPVLFAKLTILILSQFKRRHSLILYEFLKDNLCRRNRSSLTLEAVPLAEIFTLLDLQDSQYAQSGGFKEFNGKVLKPGLKEINDLSDLTVDCRLVRRQRRVVALAFDIEINDHLALSLPDLGHQTIKADFHTRVSKPDQAENTTTPEALIKRLTDFGIQRRRAVVLINQFGDLRVEMNLALVQASLADAGKGQTITNPAGYLVSAIRENWAETVPSTPVVETTSMPTNDTNHHQEEKKLEAEWQRWLAVRLREKYQQQDEAWKQERQAALLADAQATGNVVLVNAIHKQGFQGEGIPMRCLLAAVKSELLTDPEEMDFVYYQRTRNLKEESAAYNEIEIERS